MVSFLFQVYINVPKTYVPNIENIVHTLEILRNLLTTCLDYFKNQPKRQGMEQYYLYYKELISEDVIYEDLIEITIDCTYRF